MSELPFGLTEPLHYLEPFPWLRAVGVALALLALAFLWWLRRRIAARSTPAARPSRASARVPGGAGIGAELARLRQRHVVATTYRRGCHELSALLRRHLEQTRQRPFSGWTAREARQAEGDTAWTRLLALLSDLQFSRRPPDRGDFDGICELAADVLGPEAG